MDEAEKYHDPNGMTYAQYLGFTHGMERAFELMKPELEKAHGAGSEYENTHGETWVLINFETWYKTNYK